MTETVDRESGGATCRLKHTIICIDDEPQVLSSLDRALGGRGDIEVLLTNDSIEVLDWLEKRDVSLLLVDQFMPGIMGTELSKVVKRLHQNVLVVLLTGHATHEPIASALSSGCIEQVIPKPWNNEELRREIDDLLQRRRRSEVEQAQGLLGESLAMKEMRRLIAKVGPTDATVLITGETGTGKEIVSRAIHGASVNRDGPFIAVNCGAIPESLLESVLFGHVRGAFTGADRDRRGFFQVAEHGTIFLDEIGELPISLQPKILRALETREVVPIGSTTPAPISARLVAATNRDLIGMVNKGTFRTDLYYRLNVVHVVIPPLRERPDDIPILVHHLLDAICARMGRGIVRPGPDVMSAIQSYSWPGNVRELANVLERALILGEGSSIAAGDLPSTVAAAQRASSKTLKDATRAFGRDYVRRTLAECGNDKRRAARMLGINLSTLYRKITGFELDDHENNGGTAC